MIRLKLSSLQILPQNANARYKCSFGFACSLLYLFCFCFALSSPEGKDLSTLSGGGTLDSESSSLERGGLSGPNSSENRQSTTPGGDSSKWPFKPGVHLHVNGLSSLGKSVGNKPVSGFSYGTNKPTSTSTVNMVHCISGKKSGHRSAFLFLFALWSF